MKALLSFVLIAVAVTCIPLQAQANATQSAFTEYAEPLRFATASHVLALRLQALTVAPRGEQDANSKGAEEQEEGPPIPLLALFAGSLAQSDPALLQTLKADLKQVHSVAASGDETALVQAVAQAESDLARVRDVLVPDAVAGDPAFKAALIAKLANSERGLGEGYEEAANGELSAYPLAWLTLQRVDALWRELAPDLPAARDGVALALDRLNSLMPSLQPPATFSDPEDVEGAALDLVFALESALEQSLMTRGFAPPLALMQRQVEEACMAARAGHRRLALEHALAARITYGAHLASTLTMLAPDVHADLTSLWGDLDALRAGNQGAVCSALPDAVKRAQTTFG